MGFASFFKLTVNFTMWLPGVVGAKSVVSIQIFVVRNQFRGIRVFPNLGHQSSRLSNGFFPRGGLPNSMGTTVGTSHLENHSTTFQEVHRRSDKVLVGVDFAKCRCRRGHLANMMPLPECSRSSVCDWGRRVKRLEPTDDHCPHAHCKRKRKQHRDQ
jgi:hypothetical protein